MGGVEVPQAPRGWGVGIPSPLGEWSGDGSVPPPQNLFVFVVENTVFWGILARLFLKSDANGRGSNPLTPSSVHHCRWQRVDTLSAGAGAGYDNKFVTRW